MRQSRGRFAHPDPSCTLQDYRHIILTILVGFSIVVHPYFHRALTHIKCYRRVAVIDSLTQNPCYRRKRVDDESSVEERVCAGDCGALPPGRASGEAENS